MRASQAKHRSPPKYAMTLCAAGHGWVWHNLMRVKLTTVRSC